MRARVWRTHGNEAVIVGAVSRTPGRISRANARVGGNERLRFANVELARSSTSGSWWIVDFRSAERLANAPIVVLKLVTRSFRFPSLRESAAETFCVPATSFDRSCR